MSVCVYVEAVLRLVTKTSAWAEVDPRQFVCDRCHGSDCFCLAITALYVGSAEGLYSA